MRVGIGLDDATYLATQHGFISPIEDVAYLNFFGDAYSDQGRNLAPDGVPGIVTGTPGLGSTDGAHQNFASFDANNWIDTGIPDADAISIIAVCGQSGLPTGRYGVPLGSFSAGNSIGTNLIINNDDAKQVYTYEGRTASGGAVSADQITTGTANTNQFAAYCLRASSASATKLNDLTRNTSAVATGQVLARNVSAITLRIGRYGISGDNVNGPVNVAAIAIVRRLISDAEMQAQIKAMRAVLASVGIVV